MRIKITQTEKIQQLLAETQKGCSARVLNCADVQSQADAAERTLQDAGIPQKMRQGAKASILPPKVCNSYKQPAMGTHVRLERGSKAWFVTSATRGYCDSCRYGGSERLRVEVPYNRDLLDAMARGLGIQITRTEEQRQWQSLA